MRIVAGRWRGRRLQSPHGAHIRPTTDKVREAWMSILQLDIPDARVLDLFAGSGALGLEALSRGAAHVDFVESHVPSLRTLRENVELLGAEDGVTLHRADAHAFVGALSAEGPPPFEVAVADPPYGQGHAARLATAWLARPFATVFGVEHETGAALPEGGRTRRYGSTSITFFRTPEQR